MSQARIEAHTPSPVKPNKPEPRETRTKRARRAWNGLNFPRHFTNEPERAASELDLQRYFTNEPERMANSKRTPSIIETKRTPSARTSKGAGVGIEVSDVRKPLNER